MGLDAEAGGDTKLREQAMREQGRDAGTFLRDFWYIGAWAAEVTRKPMRRVIMNEPIVFYRREDETIVALESSAEKMMTGRPGNASRTAVSDSSPCVSVRCRSRISKS